MANYAGPDEVRDAAHLIRRGAVFGLDYPLDAFVPSLATLRSAPEHHLVSRHRDHRDDYLDGFWPQAASHLDGLRHRRHAEHGFYNGTPDEAVVEGNPALGINRWSEHPIAGRGVLIDVGRHRTAAGSPIDHARGEALDIGELDDTLAAQDVCLRPGDLLLIRTGWAQWFLTEATADEQNRIHQTKTCTGLAQSQAAIDWFADHRVALAASDTFALERLPAVANSPFGADTDHGMMHQELIALLGLPIGELWKLDELGDDCARDRRYECLLTVKPLNLTGGVGSPANATAIK
ncbi:cyclase family protein [Rhodococcus sp. NPDC056960]|uniref:cyclase family protein n=1 Tax=Rhodococcus sp. NPDC056960 TaxID=3345982 RepID=UPI00363BC15D